MIRLKELRKLRGLTQEELGRIVGASKASISFYESGRQEPSIDMLKKMADVLGVTTDAILGYNNETKDQPIQTLEARAVSAGMDKLPKEQREMILNMVCAMFPNNFTRGGANET